MLLLRRASNASNGFVNQNSSPQLSAKAVGQATQWKAPTRRRRRERSEPEGVAASRYYESKNRRF